MDEDIIAFIYPAVGDGYDNAAFAIAMPENKSHFVEPTREKPVASRLPRTCRTRESTVEPEKYHTLDYRACLRATFGNFPKSRHGLVVGGNPKSDFALPQLAGVSFYHFTLQFDDEGRLVVKDLNSTCGTSVKYDNDDKGHRRGGTWIIGGHEFLKNVRTIVIEVTRWLQFQVVVPAHNLKSPEYQKKIARFREGTLDTENLFRELNVTSRPGTQRPSGTHTPATGSVILRRTLGQGSFAIACHIWNASTGEEYAVKMPKNSNYDRKAWEQEACIMKRVAHERVVKFLGVTYEPNPRIRIEYVAGGSLGDHLRTHARFSAYECAQVAEQGLSFLSYLHGLVPIVVHRDIALNNILLEFRHRGKVSIKFADFGLAKEGQQLDTICGNLLYLAPEIYTQKQSYPFGNKCENPYTQAVDIWSFGVVLVQIICGLPTWRKEYEHMGIVWSQKVQEKLHVYIQATRDWLPPFLLSNILSIDPWKRRAAEDCYAEVSELLTRTGEFRELSLSGSADDNASERSTIRPDTVRGDLAMKAEVQNFLRHLADPGNTFFLGTRIDGVGENFDFEDGKSHISDIVYQGECLVDPAAGRRVLQDGLYASLEYLPSKDGPHDGISARIRGLGVLMAQGRDLEKDVDVKLDSNGRLCKPQAGEVDSGRDRKRTRYA